jgi:hypothetical protein
MELEQYWKQAAEGDDSLGNLLKDPDILRRKSQGPLQKLKSNLAKSMVYAIIITLLYALLIYYFPIWQVQVGLLVCVAFNFWIMAGTMRHYNKIDLQWSGGSVLHVLRMHHDSFRKWFRQQQTLALFVYPVAALAGFMLGGNIGSGKSVGEFFSKPKVAIAMVLMLVVLVPACYYLAKWMTHKAYGRYVDQLKELIDDLEKKDIP